MAVTDAKGRTWSACRFLLAICVAALVHGQNVSTSQADEKAPAKMPVDTSANPDSAWHVKSTFYVWFPGIHGTTGRERTVDFRASATDLLSNFKFGLMGAADFERRRWILVADFLWLKMAVSEQKTSSLPSLPPLTADVRYQQFTLTPKIGYRLVDSPKLKVDGLAGFRYWHLDADLQFTPSPSGSTFSGGHDWVDPLVGARFQVPLSSKVLVTVLGDVGGWGVGSELDYQVLGTLGFRVNPKVTLHTGYRYLYINYRPKGFVYDTAFSGIVLGMTFNFKPTR